MAPPPDRWLVYACATTFAAEVAEIIWRTGGEIAALVDNLDGGPAPSPLGPIIAPAALTAEHLALPTVVPLTTPGFRHTAVAEARTHGCTRFPPLVDPTAVVARTATTGEGTVINAGAVIGAHTRLGAFVTVNRSASVGHDDRIDDYATLGPGCVLTAEVHVGRGAFLGAGCVLLPKIRIGANAVVGAGAVVMDHVPDGAVVLGNPAKVIRTAPTGYGGGWVPPEP